MLLGIISDSHDNLPRLEQAVSLFKERGVDVIIHAGDIVSPFAAKLLVQSEIKMLAIYGNNDGELKGLANCLDITPSPRKLELAGRQIIVAHSPDELPPNAKDEADIIITGHTHEILNERGDALHLNPGESCGYLTGRATVMLLTLPNMEVELCELS